jgi:hypothetical protein
MSVASDVISTVRDGFNLIRASLIVPGGSTPISLSVEAGATLGQALESANVPFSTKQTYVDANGVALNENSVLSDGATVFATTTQSNG